MGILDLKHEKEYLKIITDTLKRRGMKAVKEGSDDIWLVAIYPRAIYWLEDPSDWCEVSLENKILIEKEVMIYALYPEE